jgi:hypothetical protein
VVAEDRQQHAVAQVRLGMGPFDVEVGSEAARRPVLEDVPPPRVVGTDGHVVGHDVEHLAEPELTERLAERPVTRLPAQLRADAVVVDDVVAVRRAGHGLEDR